MNLTSLFSCFTTALNRRSASVLLGLLTAAACGEDEEAPAPQPDFAIAVSNIDGKAPDEQVTVRCDGKLAVAVSITSSIENIEFVLRPRHVCGSSKRCGYVRVEGLDASAQVLSYVDTVTTAGVLELDANERELLSQIRVSLISGVDQKPVLNADLSEVTAVVEPSFTPEADCPGNVGAGGQGGGGEGPVGGAPSDGGAGGQAGGTAEGGAAGAAGALEPALGGAGGEPSAAGAGGATL
jgi:hypothetical protein